ncbi:MAG: hypothetical protein MJE68_11490 [Proteobacteria bacterium]|nr:hypothetical protein [Pseudomonadota bacterium]
MTVRLDLTEVDVKMILLSVNQTLASMEVHAMKAMEMQQAATAQMDLKEISVKMIYPSVDLVLASMKVLVLKIQEQ